MVECRMGMRLEALMDNRVAIGTLVALVIALSLLALLVSRLRARRASRRLAELLSAYFAGDLPLDQLSGHASEAASRSFLGSADCQAAVQAEFQRAARAKLASDANPLAVEKALLAALAAVKAEFGLPDRYQIEAWRPGRE
jgi:hypothetical protein